MRLRLFRKARNAVVLLGPVSRAVDIPFHLLPVTNRCKARPHPHAVHRGKGKSRGDEGVIGAGAAPGLSLVGTSPGLPLPSSLLGGLSRGISFVTVLISFFCDVRLWPWLQSSGYCSGNVFPPSYKHRLTFSCTAFLHVLVERLCREPAFPSSGLSSYQLGQQDSVCRRASQDMTGDTVTYVSARRENLSDSRLRCYTEANLKPHSTSLNNSVRISKR